MQNNKDYKIRGLIFGLIVYSLIFLKLVFDIKGGGDNGIVSSSVAIYIYAILFSPIIFVGMGIGWIIGKFKNRNVI